MARAIYGVRIAFPLYDEEVHLLAKSDIGSVADLAVRGVCSSLDGPGIRRLRRWSRRARGGRARHIGGRGAPARSAVLGYGVGNVMMPAAQYVFAGGRSVVQMLANLVCAGYRRQLVVGPGRV